MSILAKHDDLQYFWVLRLIAHAIMSCMTGNVFDHMIWTLWKSANTHSDLGSRVSQDPQDPGHFSQNFGLVKTELNRTRKADINAISCNRNKWCIFLILARIWNQRKRWLGSSHISADRQQGSFMFGKNGWLFPARRLFPVWMNIMHPARDAKFRPGDLAGPKAQSRPGFLRSPNYGCRAYVELGKYNHICIMHWLIFVRCLKDDGQTRCRAHQVSCGATLGSGLGPGDFFCILISHSLHSGLRTSTFPYLW